MVDLSKGNSIHAGDLWASRPFAPLLMLLALASLSFVEAICFAQQTIEITGDRLSGFVLPNEPLATNLELRALRAHAWTVDDTKRLWLDGDVEIDIGAYSFQSSHAAVWINRIPSADGLINQIAVYFDEVEDPTKQAGLGVSGGQLLVTGSARGQVRLNVALLEESAPPSILILRQAEARLAEYLQRLLAEPPPLQSHPSLQQPAPDPQFHPVPGGTVDEEKLKLPKRVQLPPAEGGSALLPWLAHPEGIIRFSAGNIEIAQGEQENIITAIGSIVVEYIAHRRDEEWSQLTLAAERAVIFTDPGPLEAMAGQLEAESVRGIYLEGNVTATAQEGDYSVRAPHVYYDFRARQAIMLNSVLRVQSRSSRVPTVARAQELRQVSESQWTAKKVTVSTSDFFTPHLAIGAEQMTITERPIEGQDNQTQTYLDSQDNTLRASGIPVFYWPRMRGDVESVPLKSAEIGTRDNDGLRLLTTWNLFTLLGKKEPEGVEADLNVDAFTQRGIGLGTQLRYNVGESEGMVDLYGLFDQGVDRTSSGIDVDPDSEWRGVALLEHQTQLSRYWSLQAQAALISDDTFMSAWREDEFSEHREFENSLYLKHQRDNAVLTLLGKYSIQDFLSNSYLLANRQYAVDKLPELTYRRYGDSLFGDRFTYSMENRLTRMALAFQHTSPGEAGLRPRAFDIGIDEQISDVLLARGLHENWVHRLDSRHELALPLHPGIFNVTPFIVGRFTGYDDDFDEFSSDSDSLRFFGAAGVRVNTQFQRVYNGVENRLFDLHRLRHLIEPYMTLWSAYASVGQDDLPVYDDEVESLADGSAVQLGVRNIWQTQRGGPGRWRSVDWLTLDTSIVIDSEDEGDGAVGGVYDPTPTPQFFDYRPEYSQLGDHVHAQALWLISDSLSLIGETTYALEQTMFARSSIGMELRHSSVLTTYIEYRTIEAQDAQLLGIGWNYQLTPKYRITLTPQYDFRAEDFRSVSMRLTRSFPDFNFTIAVRYDQIRGDTGFGASLGLVEF